MDFSGENVMSLILKHGIGFENEQTVDSQHCKNRKMLKDTIHSNAKTMLVEKNNFMQQITNLHDDIYITC